MTARGYLLAIIADAGDEHPDKRVLRLLRSLKDFGFAPVDVQGSDPPSPGLLETIEREFGISYSGKGPTAEHRAERIETATISRYLVRAWHMEPGDITELLARCSADPALQSELLVLALETP
jgi:hypothetical protein